MMRNPLRKLGLVAGVVCLLAGCGPSEVVGPKPPGPDPGPGPAPAVAYNMKAAIDGRQWNAIMPAEYADSACAVASFDVATQMLVVAGLRVPTSIEANDLSMMLMVAITPLKAGAIPMGDVDTTGGVIRVAAAGFMQANPSNNWVTGETPCGQLVLDRVDAQAGTLLGHFEFDAVSDDDGTTIRVRSGEFKARLELAMPALAQRALASRSAVAAGHALNGVVRDELGQRLMAHRTN